MLILDTSLLNTQQYKVRIKGKVEQSRENSFALPYASVKVRAKQVALDNGRQLYFTYWKNDRKQQYKVIPEKLTMKSTKFCQPCNINNSLFCKHLR